MLDALFFGHLLCLLQRLQGCRWDVVHLVAREESAKVQGAVGESAADHPAAHLANHLYMVVQARDDEIREFYPHAGIAHGKDGVEDGLQMSAADLHVDVVAKRFHSVW